MAVKPFLKWAGGKHRLVDQILSVLPAGTRFVEPFAGSASVYLSAPFEKALVCDVNRDVIALYSCLQKEGMRFIRYCATFFGPENNTEHQFYALRERFNRASELPERAALLLYLNRHAYNGLVRYNGKGEFNVPFGRYKRPYFPLDELSAFYAKTKTTRTTFAVMDFKQAFRKLRPGDVVYCDPPYVPLSATANFTAYTGKTFCLQDQEDLAKMAQKAARRGIPVVISNHDTELTQSLYAGAEIARFSVRRSISCSGSTRGPVSELLAVFT